MKVLMLSVIKLGGTRCRYVINGNILNFAVSPLCVLYMNFLMLSVINLGCKRCIGWKW